MSDMGMSGEERKRVCGGSGCGEGELGDVGLCVLVVVMRVYQCWRQGTRTVMVVVPTNVVICRMGRVLRTDHVKHLVTITADRHGNGLQIAIDDSLRPNPSGGCRVTLPDDAGLIRDVKR